MLLTNFEYFTLYSMSTSQWRSNDFVMRRDNADFLKFTSFFIKTLFFYKLIVLLILKKKLVASGVELVTV